MAASVFLLPEFPVDHAVVGVSRDIPAGGEWEDGCQHPIEERSPQPGKAEHESRSKPCHHDRDGVAPREEVQQAERQQAHDEWPADRFGQQTDNAQLALADPRKPGKQGAKQQACRDPACAEILGQHPDEQEAGIGHRAGQGDQHQQDDSGRELWPGDGRSD